MVSAPQVFPGDTIFPSNPSQDLPSPPTPPLCPPPALPGQAQPPRGFCSHEGAISPQPASPAQSLSPELQGPFLAFL